jgi:hypothetical protein
MLKDINISTIYIFFFVMEEYSLNSLEPVVSHEKNIYHQFKLCTYRFLETNETHSKLAQRFHFCMITLISLLIIASSLMYFIEHDTQPDAFSSIPATMWWAIVTLTTVGYGDIYPITTMGKILGGSIALLGIGFFALPAGILASGFSDEIHKKYARQKFCSHCGTEIK